VTARRVIGVLARSVSLILPLAAVAAAALMLVPGLLGYQRYVITSGSMTGTIDRGSLIYDKVVPAASLKVGDIITYTPPPSSGVFEPVTHRIVWAGRDRFGHPSFRTKGDFNKVADPWRFVLERPTQARVAFHIPYAGFALGALTDRHIRMLLIGLPALLIALAVLARLWRDAGEEVRRQRELAADRTLEAGS
jgi:signal peptidase